MLKSTIIDIFNSIFTTLVFVKFNTPAYTT